MVKLNSTDETPNNPFSPWLVDLLLSFIYFSLFLSSSLLPVPCSPYNFIHSEMHTRYNLLLVALTGTLSLLSTLTTADLICQSPTSLPTNTLQPGTSLTLKFTNKPASLGSALLSDVSANLICTST